jgi:hypothetical protein
MGFRLTPIFITNQASVSNEELLEAVGLTGLIKGKVVDFYDTNKDWDTVFIGSKGDCKILCVGDLCYEAFVGESRLLRLKDCEIAAIIWNETADNYGFCLIKNGKIERKVMVSGDEFSHDYGQPIQEEIDLANDSLFEPEEIEEILEREGQEGLERRIKSEIICRATNRIVKRYLGANLVEIQESIELYEYEEV